MIDWNMDLNFRELQMMVEQQADNEFEDFDVFLWQFNNVLFEINQLTGYKFKRVPVDGTITENTLEDINDVMVTKFPPICANTLISGLTWKLQEIEQEDNIYYWEQKFHKNVENLLIWLNGNVEDMEKNAVNSTPLSMDWEE